MHAASATKGTYFFIAPSFDPGSWTTGLIVSWKFAAYPNLFYPLCGASFEAYKYFESIQEEEPQRVSHYKVLITGLDGSTLEWYWKTEWNLDPYVYTYPDAIEERKGVFTHGTGALKGFHGQSYALVTVFSPIDPEFGGSQIALLRDPVSLEPASWAWYRTVPSHQN